MKTKHRFCISGLCALLTLVLLMSTACAAYKTLEKGSKGAEVLQLQQTLQSLGYDVGKADGVYGTQTRQAVISFQKKNGLKADGKAGNLTLTRLYGQEASAQQSSATANTAITAFNSGITVPANTKSTTLKYGDSGSAVKTLQQNLNTLGYSVGTADGKFGKATYNALIKFQQEHGLTADGLAGTSTRSLLTTLAAEKSTASAQSTAQSTGSDASLFTATLRNGSTGKAVTAAQNRLKELGYYTGTVDGKYGNGSVNAVRSFQKANGLSADGLLGRATWNKLFSTGAVAANAAPAATPAPAQTETETVLKVGASGESVKKLQQALTALGWPLSADGKYGTGTAAAVRNFQEVNGLTATGNAGAATQQLLYSGKAQKAKTSGKTEASNTEHGTVKGSNGATIHLLHWYNTVKPALSNGKILHIYDPATAITWDLKVISRGHHCDCEPLTATDTENMNRAFGKTTWTPKPVYVQLPSGIWTLASTHNTPHETYSIKDNNFNGHLCVHFLRDMDECASADPDYGVTNQNTIRTKWKELTGVTVQ